LTSIASIESDVLGVESWWLGLSDLGHEGRWIWQNSVEEVSYTNWAENYPTAGDVEQNCVVMKTENELEWSDELCTTTRASPICQTGYIQADTTTTLSPTNPTSTPIPLDTVQLVGGDGYSRGNVFTYNYEGYFGPICDDYWSLENARVVCAQLGFSRDNATVYVSSTFGSVPYVFAMDDVQCSGNEATIQECDYNASDDCNANEGAGVQCFEL